MNQMMVAASYYRVFEPVRFFSLQWYVIGVEFINENGGGPRVRLPTPGRGLKSGK
jgi:hypothetical protein